MKRKYFLFKRSALRYAREVWVNSWTDTSTGKFLVYKLACFYIVTPIKNDLQANMYAYLDKHKEILIIQWFN